MVGPRRAMLVAVAVAVGVGEGIWLGLKAGRGVGLVGVDWVGATGSWQREGAARADRPRSAGANSLNNGTVPFSSVYPLDIGTDLFPTALLDL